MENLYFNINDLRHVGENVVIGKSVRIRHPELVSIGDNSIIDDFTYISTALDMGRYCHIGPGCMIIGSPKGKLVMDDITGCAPNCSLITSSDDYISGIAGPNIPEEFRGKITYGLIHLKQYCALGTNTIVHPNVTVEEGVATASLTVVKRSLEAWTVYGGDPAQALAPRNRKSVERLGERFKNEYL